MKKSNISNYAVKNIFQSLKNTLITHNKCFKRTIYYILKSVKTKLI